MVRSAQALEVTHRVSVVVLDKTGTLTTGRPVVTDLIAATAANLDGGTAADSWVSSAASRGSNSLAGILSHHHVLEGVEVDTSENELLRLAASAERVSEHPIAQAIVQEAEARGLQLSEIGDFQAIPGQGIQASIDAGKILLGNQGLMQAKEVELAGLVDTAGLLAEQGKTPMFLAVNGTAIGVIAVADTLKPTSQDGVAQLQRMGLEVVMLSGDNVRTARAIAYHRHHFALGLKLLHDFKLVLG